MTQANRRPPAGGERLTQGFPVTQIAGSRSTTSTATRARPAGSCNTRDRRWGWPICVAQPSGREVLELPRRPGHLDDLRVGGKDRDSGTTLAAVLRDTQTDGLVALHRGVIVYEAYFNGLTPETPHMWQSVSKSLVSCVVGNLVADGRIDLDGRLSGYVSELDGSAYGDAVVRHLLDMQVGIDYSEDYADPDSDVNELDRIYGVRPPRGPGHPGSTYDYAMTTRKRWRARRELRLRLARRERARLGGGAQRPASGYPSSSAARSGASSAVNTMPTSPSMWPLARRPKVGCAPVCATWRDWASHCRVGASWREGKWCPRHGWTRSWPAATERLSLVTKRPAFFLKGRTRTASGWLAREQRQPSWGSASTVRCST